MARKITVINKGVPEEMVYDILLRFHLFKDKADAFLSSSPMRDCPAEENGSHPRQLLFEPMEEGWLEKYRTVHYDYYIGFRKRPENYEMQPYLFAGCPILLDKRTGIYIAGGHE